MTGACAFFYGTLMHPKILKAVIKNDGTHLEICPAVLLEHTRHKVKNAQYPGLIPYSQSVVLSKRELSLEEGSVRGTLVNGLTREDMKLLDYFEGPEYIRKGVRAHPLEPMIKLSEYGNEDASLIPAHPPAINPADLPLAVDVETYIYLRVDKLDAELWSFEDFVKNNAWKWYGGEPGEDESTSIVERRRAEQTELANLE